jgi:hypothetical protein
MGKMSNHFDGLAINKVLPISNLVLPRILQIGTPELAAGTASAPAAIQLRLSNHMLGAVVHAAAAALPPDRAQPEKPHFYWPFLVDSGTDRAVPVLRRGARPAGCGPAAPDRAVLPVKTANGDSPQSRQGWPPIPPWHWCRRPTRCARAGPPNRARRVAGRAGSGTSGSGWAWRSPRRGSPRGKPRRGAAPCRRRSCPRQARNPSQRLSNGRLPGGLRALGANPPYGVIFLNP